MRVGPGPRLGGRFGTWLGIGLGIGGAAIAVACADTDAEGSDC